MSTIKKPAKFDFGSPDNKTGELEEVALEAVLNPPTAPQQQQQREQHEQQFNREQSLNAQFEDLERFLGKSRVKHVDFDFKSPEYTIFRLQDYNWEEHGCSLISKFLPETGELLDEEFNEILNLTDYS